MTHGQYQSQAKSNIVYWYIQSNLQRAYEYRVDCTKLSLSRSSGEEEGLQEQILTCNAV